MMVYLGKPVFDLDANKVKRGYAALARMEHQLAGTRFLIGDAFTLADVSLLAYTRVAHEGGFHLGGYASVRRWIGECEQRLGAAAHSGVKHRNSARTGTCRILSRSP
jgi:glutathione S-transferase